MRITQHPILGKRDKQQYVKIICDGQPIEAIAGEPIAAALMAAGKTIFRYTRKKKDPRGVFCAIGQCTECMMTVDGIPNVRTCITPVQDGMNVQTQHGLGQVKANP